MIARARQDNQPGYVLHSYAFRESSLVVETFTRSHGRVAMVARGARRPRSALRGSITVARTVPQLKAFVEAGGTQARFGARQFERISIEAEQAPQSSATRVSS